MSLITLDIKNESDYKNRMIILDLVKKYFHLDQENINKFENLLFHPKIDEMFIPFINDSFRIEKKLEGKNNKEFDLAWNSFAKSFINFINKFQITYEEFTNNSIIIEGNKRKLFKFIYEYFSDFNNDVKEKIEDLSHNIYNSELISQVYKYKNGRDIKTVLNNILERIGADKIPLAAEKAVMSFNFVDWFLCSTSENWSSCLSLDSTFSASYWAGLPGLIGDHSRGLFYITDCDVKEYLDIKIERFISRSWFILDQSDYINLVRFYPINVGADLVFKFGFRYGELKRSKYPVDNIYDKQGNSLYIFQDTTSFDNEKYLISGNKGWKGFHKSGKEIYYNFLECGKNLKLIINNGTTLGNFLIKNTCEKCASILDKKPKELSKSFYCEDCYRKEKGSYCVCCRNKLSDEELGNFILNDYPYCEDCYNDNVCTCNNCDETLHIDNAYYVGDNCYCTDCFHENFFVCEACENTFDNQYFNETPNGSFYCNDCYSEHVGTCDICGENLFFDDLRTDGLNEDYVCQECFDKKYCICDNCETINSIGDKCDCEEESAVST